MYVYLVLTESCSVCVMFVTFFDTCMVTLAAMFVWRISPYYVFLPWLTIACLDGTYLSSALTKVPNGAWFTITLASVLAALFILWRFGKEQQWAAEAADRLPTTHFVHKREDGQVELTPKYGGGTMSSIKGLGVFFDKAGETTPIVFSQFATKLVAAPEVMVLFHMRPLETPSVAPEDRYTVSRLAIPNCYRLVLRHGYMDEVITPDLAAVIYAQIRSYVVRRGKRTVTTTTGAMLTPEQQARQRTIPVASITDAATKQEPETTIEPSDFPPSDETEQKDSQESTTDVTELAMLVEAYNHQVLYIVGKEQLRIKKGTGIFRKVLLSMFLWIRENTRTKVASLKIPTDKVMEVGFVKDI